MKKKFSPIAILMLILVLLLCSCGTTPENENEETTIPTETVEETTEAESELDPEWLSDAAIDEAYACLFPSEGEINVEKAQEILLPLVEAGNAEAQYYWGYIYDFLLVDNTGEGEREALYWYELSAKQGFVKAYLALAAHEYIGSEEQANELIDAAKQAGLFELSSEELGADGCYYIGAYYWHQENYNVAIDWWRNAADLGSTSAMRELGWGYYTGGTVEKDLDTALEYLGKAAETKDVKCMHDYAYILTNKKVALYLINKKYATNLPGYHEAAAAGDSEAMYNIAVMYYCGYGGMDKDYDTYRQWILKAAEAGHPTAMYLQAAHSDESEQESAEWYRKAAEAGHREAMYWVGQHSEDPAEAAKWYLKSAEAGYDDAMVKLCDIYFNGIGVEKDYEAADMWSQRIEEQSQRLLHNDCANEYGNILSKALEYYEIAADKGHATSMNNIGYWQTNAIDFLEYEPGRPVYQTLHYDKQEDWYKKSAEAGYSVAMLNLGYLHRNGGSWQVAQDYDEAMRWYIKAYAAGNSDAEEEIWNLLANKQGVNAFFENYGEMMIAAPVQ